MLSTHEKINYFRLKKSKDPLLKVANYISNQHKLIIFDELEILDIADAMIVSRLFYLLINKGVSFLITSNYKPEELYKNGLQRSQFEPFIHIVSKIMMVKEIDNNKDLRILGAFPERDFYYFPLNTASKKIFNDKFYGRNNKNIKIKKKIISIGREIVFENVISDKLLIDFDFICSYKFSASDYISLSKKFNSFFIDNIPILGRNNLNEIRRFIILIDILYEKKSNLFIRAENDLFNIFKLKNSDVPYVRTISRISEMTNSNWKK